MDRPVANHDKVIDFYFDYISSNAYLAWVALPALANRYGYRIDPVPTLFAGFLEAYGQLGPAEIPVKSFWMWKNNLRKAALLGVPLQPPAFHPFNPLLALRVSCLPMSRAQRDAVVTRLFAAVWADGQHVSDPHVVAALLDVIGLDGRALVDAAQQPEAKARLHANGQAAIAAGAFGVPTMRVGTEIFWGYDDLPYLELLLAGRDPVTGASVPTAAPRASAVRKRVTPR